MVKFQVFILALAFAGLQARGVISNLPALQDVPVITHLPDATAQEAEAEIVHLPDLSVPVFGNLPAFQEVPVITHLPDATAQEAEAEIVHLPDLSVPVFGNLPSFGLPQVVPELGHLPSAEAGALPEASHLPGLINPGAVPENLPSATIPEAEHLPIEISPESEQVPETGVPPCVSYIKALLETMLAKISGGASGAVVIPELGHLPSEVEISPEAEHLPGTVESDAPGYAHLPGVISPEHLPVEHLPGEVNPALPGVVMPSEQSPVEVALNPCVECFQHVQLLVETLMTQNVITTY